MSSGDSAGDSASPACPPPPEPLLCHPSLGSVPRHLLLPPTSSAQPPLLLAWPAATTVALLAAGAAQAGDPDAAVFPPMLGPETVSLCDPAGDLPRKPSSLA
jgi:hypothetical protein